MAWLSPLRLKLLWFVGCFTFLQHPTLKPWSESSQGSISFVCLHYAFKDGDDDIDASAGAGGQPSILCGCYTATGHLHMHLH